MKLGSRYFTGFTASKACAVFGITLLAYLQGISLKVKTLWPSEGHSISIIKDGNDSKLTTNGRSNLLPHYSHAHKVPAKLTSTEIPASISLEPLFQCKDYRELSFQVPGRTQKLAFVHIFKTAGSTLRVLFDSYARKCRASWQVTIRCTGVNASSVKYDNSTWWHTGYDEACVQKKGVKRDGSQMQERTSFNIHHLNEEVDIVGGHMELGAADYSWLKHDGLTYLAFFRNATSKFVSARMYRKKRTLEEHVSVIRKEVESNLRHGLYFEGYYKYLITPFQKEELRQFNRTLTIIEKVQLMQKNLIDYNVICGITERMPESLEILNHLIDADGGARDVFLKTGMRDQEGGNPYRQKVRNHAEVPTSSVISEISKDVELFAKLQEYVSFEQKVTDFALEIHMKQYASVSSAVGFDN